MQNILALVVSNALLYATPLNLYRIVARLLRKWVVNVGFGRNRGFVGPLLIGCLQLDLRRFSLALTPG